MKVFVALIGLLVSAAAPAATSNPDVLVDQFVSAWNTHDLKKFDALCTHDAVWVPIAEERTEGQAAIVSEFAKVHAGAGWAVKTTIAKKDVPEVHFLKPDVATVFFHVDFIEDGKPVVGLQRALILVAVKQAGQWKIAAGQLTKESPAPQ